MKSQADTARCMGQLQRLGVGLTEYALNHGHYPQPPQNYPAGYYGVQLLKENAELDAHLLACPTQTLSPESHWLRMISGQPRNRRRHRRSLRMERQADRRMPEIHFPRGAPTPW